MVIARQSADGDDAGKWYAVTIEHKAARRVGYCAFGCPGHESSDSALAHHLQYQLDRETDLWLDRRGLGGACDICGQHTTLHARLGRGTRLFRLCHTHHTTGSLQILYQRRLAQQALTASA